MGGRSFRVRTVATWTTIATVVITVTSASSSASSPSVLPLHVLLTVSSNLGTTSRGTLIREAERIWGHEQVKIEWAPPGHTVEHPDAPLRVLVVSRPQTARAPGEWPVAELFPEAVPRPLAVASIDSAERVVDEAARTSGHDARAPREYRLGLVLGRAVAHEIGHFLLATRTHAESGLMRATVDVREFAAVSGEPFRLDRDASQWLRGRLTASDAVSSLRAGGFRYGRSETPNPQLPNPNVSVLGVGSW